MIKCLIPLALVMLSALASAGHGQPPQGSAGIFFTATPTTGADAVRNGVAAFAPVPDFFVVSFDVPGGMEGYELSVALPPGLVVTGGRSLPQGATDGGAGADNWIVAAGSACVGKVGTFTLVRYAAPLFLANPGNDVPIWLRGSTPSSVPGGWAGYRACNSRGEMRSFAPIFKNPCAVINPSITWPAPVAAVGQPSLSFGALKAGF
jgi:hypothetical protein